MMWLHRYTVTGTGSFPIDMLRYDASHPAREEGSAKITMTSSMYRQWHECEPKPVIELVHFGARRDWRPTDVRWQSFGWFVTTREPAAKI